MTVFDYLKKIDINQDSPAEGYAPNGSTRA